MFPVIEAGTFLKRSKLKLFSQTGGEKKNMLFKKKKSLDDGQSLVFRDDDVLQNSLRTLGTSFNTFSEMTHIPSRSKKLDFC